jgi:hypothetical protein
MCCQHFPNFGPQTVSFIAIFDLKLAPEMQKAGMTLPLATLKS